MTREAGMEVVHTLMSLFDRPGPPCLLLHERGLAARKIPVPSTPGGEPTGKPAALMAHALEIEYLLADTTPLDRNFFAAARKLRLVAMFGVGLDHIDLRAAAEHNIRVTNVPGGNSRCVAELALAMMLDLAHKVTWMHTELVDGIWRARAGMEVGGKTLGIVGLGHIGQQVAVLGKALGMRVMAANRTPRPELARELEIFEADLQTVLAEADFVSLHIPGGPDSWRLGAEELACMKQTAFLINTARGDVLDLDALTEALVAKRLAGAGLDVFPVEPMPPGHPIFTLPQVVATPHAGAMSREAILRVATSCLDEVVRMRNGEKSPNAAPGLALHDVKRPHPEKHKGGGRNGP